MHRSNKFVSGALMLRSPPRPITGLLGIIMILHIINATEALVPSQPYKAGDHNAFRTPHEQAKDGLRQTLTTRQADNGPSSESTFRLDDRVQKKRTIKEEPPVPPPIEERSHFWDFLRSPSQTWSQYQEGKISGLEWSAHLGSKAASTMQTFHALWPCVHVVALKKANQTPCKQSMMHCYHGLQNAGLSLTATTFGRVSQPFTQFEQNELQHQKKQYLAYLNSIEEYGRTRADLDECTANHGSLQEVALEMLAEVETLNTSRSSCEQRADDMRQMLANCDAQLITEQNECESKLETQRDEFTRSIEDYQKDVAALTKQLEQANLVNNIAKWPFMGEWYVRVAIELIAITGGFVCAALAGVMKWLAGVPVQWMLAFQAIVFFALVVANNPMRIWHNQKIEYFVDLYTSCLNVCVAWFISVIMGAFAAVVIRKLILPAFRDGMQQASTSISELAPMHNLIAELRALQTGIHDAQPVASNTNRIPVVPLLHGSEASVPSLQGIRRRPAFLRDDQPVRGERAYTALRNE